MKSEFNADHQGQSNTDNYCEIKKNYKNNFKISDLK